MTHHVRTNPTPRRGFSLIEMLMVVAIILLVLSIVIVAVNSAVKSAQKANTRNLMTNMRNASVVFKNDIGYLPPVLGGQQIGTPQDLRALYQPPAMDPGTYHLDVQEWYSVTSPAEFLIGYGSEREDGHGVQGQSLVPGNGFRHPGPDGVWNATVVNTAVGSEFVGDGSLSARNPAPQGRVYGPYFELENDRLLGAIDAVGRVHFPGDPGYHETFPKVICDYWGNPIRYYRRAYPERGLTRQFQPDVFPAPMPAPSLADVFVLRPFELGETTAVDIDGTRRDANEDTTVTHELMTAEIAFFSTGPDRIAQNRYRVDFENEYNADNIVELGQ